MPNISLVTHRFTQSPRWPFISAAVLAGALACIPGALHAQGFVSSGGASYTAGNATSSTQNTGSAKDKVVFAEPKKMEVGVHNAILTVDGMVAKVGLNYPVNAPFLYFYVPGLGTAIVSQSRFPNSVLQKDAFKGSVLTVWMNGHEIQLNNSGSLLKDHHGVEAWVALDTNTQLRERMPEMGYGTTLKAPYQWPLAKGYTAESTSYAPPVPANLKPKAETVSSYSVTVGPADQAAETR